MTTFQKMYTQLTGTVVQSFPNGDDEAFTTVLITRPNFSEEWNETLEENLEEAEDLLADEDIMVFGFYNIQPNDFSAGDPPPQFDVVLVFKHSEGGPAGPVYGIDMETAELEPWADSFGDCGFQPVQD